MRFRLRGSSLVLFLVAGGALARQVPVLAVGAPARPAAPSVPPKPPAPDLPAPEPKPQPPQGIPGLQALVEAAENAIKVEGKEDWDAATSRCDEAEALIAQWPDAELKKPAVLALLDRLHQVQKQLEEDEDAAAPPGENGPIVPEEAITLSGEDLRAEQEKVKAAGQGALFDFPIDLNSKVLGILYTFTTAKRAFMENALSRASQWMPMLRQVFAEEGIPQDLAYLAVIESGFRNEAKSRAAAVGMWQFIRSTGRIYGLTGNAWVEERRDPVKASRAAARYLKRLYETSGDWYLALAGYNAGPLTPERAAQALGTRNYWDIYRSRYLRNETKNYVPSLCAAILIGRFPERYGLNVTQLRPYAFETVDIERQTSLSVIARLAQTDTATLRELNPELLRATTPPGRYTLRVPPGMAVSTARALAKLPSQKLLEFRTYVLRRGDTAAKVAAKFKVSLDDLLATNDLQVSQFRRGRRIQVPPPSAIPIDDRDLLPAPERARILGDHPLPSLPALPPEEGARATAADPRPAAADPAPAAKPAVASPAAISGPPSAMAAVPGGTVPRLYVVQAGDTLASIGRAFGVSLGELERLNPGGAAGLKPGDSVHLPAPAPAVDAVPPAARPQSAQATRTHTVKRKETIYAIAQRYGVTVAELKFWNHLRTARVRVGQRLKVSEN